MKSRGSLHCTVALGAFYIVFPLADGYCDLPAVVVLGPL